MKSLGNHTPASGYLALVLAAFIWSTFGALSRVVGYGIPIMYQNVTRGIVAMAIIASIVIWQKLWKPVHPSKYGALLTRSIGGIAAFLLFFIAANHIPLGLMYFLFYGASTLTSFLLSYMLFKEKVTRKRVLALGLALFGVALVYQVNSFHYPTLYLMLSLLSGIGFSVWSMIGKLLGDSINAHQQTLIDEFIVVIIYIVLSLLWRETWIIPQMTIEWGVSLLFGVLFIVTSLLCLYGLSKVEAQVGSLILLSEILFAVVIAYIFYQEQIAVSTLIGGVCIISSMILSEVQVEKILNNYANRRKSISK